MAVESINDALCVDLTGTNNVALVLGILIAERREATFNGAVDKVLAAFDGVRLRLDASKNVFLPELTLVAHIENRLLRLAATVLQLLHNVHVAQLCRIDNPLCRETYLSTNLLDSRLNVAYGLLQLIEVAVEVTCQLAEYRSVAIYGIHEEVCVVIIRHGCT